LLNFFNTFDGLPDTTDNCTNGVGGTATDCRGADTAAEFSRQWCKTLAAILATEADIIGISEIENDGYGSRSAIAFLVGKLNEATAPGTYAFINADASTGQLNALGTDATKVGMLYKPAKVTPIGLTAVLNSKTFVNGGDALPRNRPSLAQAFEQNSNRARFIIDLNHLKSKGSACELPDAGDGQGNCNLVRVNATNELMAWLTSDPTGTHDPDILLIGDYNSYAMEDPIIVIENAGFTNLTDAFLDMGAYSYVFDGQWGYLDHTFGTPSIVPQITGVGDFHINSDEPSVLDYNTDFKTANLKASLYSPNKFRASDHDPVIIGLNLRNNPPLANAGGPYRAIEGDIVSLSASGSDPEGTRVKYDWDLNDDNIFETPGQNVSVIAMNGTRDYTISVRVSDAKGNSTVASTIVSVKNAAPVVDDPAIFSEPSLEGSFVIARATFNDPGINDAPFACSVNYGDGSGDKKGIIVGNRCYGLAHIYPVFGQYSIKVSVKDEDGETGSQSSTHNVIFLWSGFLPPFENLPIINDVNTGDDVLVNFALGGNRGLNIFEEGYPLSMQIDCDSGAVFEGNESHYASGAGLSYNAHSESYIYSWRTNDSWAGTCRQLVVKLVDGTEHLVNFRFN
jgi:hypothetical protein